MWSRHWPTEPGWYWFYGITSNIAEHVTMMPVQVIKTQNALAFIANGAFLFHEEGAVGWWIPAEVPQPPEEVRRPKP